MDGSGRMSRLTASRTAATQRAGLVWLDREPSSTGGEHATSRRRRVQRHRDRRREVGAPGAPRGNERSARVESRGVGTLQGQRAIAPRAQASSMPAGTLSKQLRELGIHEQRVLPNARSMPSAVGRASIRCRAFRSQSRGSPGAESSCLAAHQSRAPAASTRKHETRCSTVEW